MFGYRTIDDYYMDASPNRRLKSVGIPVLCLNAVDDVFSPSHGKSIRLLPWCDVTFFFKGLLSFIPVCLCAYMPACVGT